MELQAVILDALEEKSGNALVFDEVVKGVAERLEDQIRQTLNDLTDKQKIQRHVGGRDHPWRYQAYPARTTHA